MLVSSSTLFGRFCTLQLRTVPSYKNEVEGPPFERIEEIRKESQATLHAATKTAFRKNFPAVENEVRLVCCNAGEYFEGDDNLGA